MPDKIKEAYEAVKDNQLFLDENDFRTQLQKDPKGVFDVFNENGDTKGLFIDYSDFENVVGLKKKDPLSFGFATPGEALEGSAKSPAVSSSTAGTKTNTDRLRDINAASQQRVGILKERVGLKRSLLDAQAPLKEASTELERLTGIYNDPNLSPEERNAAGQQANQLMQQTKEASEKYAADAERYNTLLEDERKTITDINTAEKLRQQGLEKDYSNFRSFVDNVGSATMKALGRIEEFGLSTAPTPVKFKDDYLLKLGDELISQETPKNFQNMFKGEFSGKKLGYIASTALGQTVPTVAAGILSGGTAVPAIVGGSLGYDESYKTLKETGLTDDEAAIASLGLAIPLGLLEKAGMSDVITALTKKGLQKEVATEIAKQVAGKQLSKEALFEISKKTVGQKLKDFSVDVAKAGWKEPLTEMEQAAVSELGKQGAEAYTGNDSNANQTTGEYLLDTGEKILEEGVGGLIGGVGFGAVAAAANRPSYNVSTYQQVQELKVPELFEDFKENLQDEVEKGVITPEAAEQAITNVQSIHEADAKIPATITDPEQRTQAVNMIIEKNDLTKELEGKDEALTQPIQDRLTEIDTGLKEIAAGKKMYQGSDFMNETGLKPGFYTLEEVEASKEKKKPKSVTPDTTPVVDLFKSKEPITSIQGKGVYDAMVSGEPEQVQAAIETVRSQIVDNEEAARKVYGDDIVDSVIAVQEAKPEDLAQDKKIKSKIKSEPVEDTGVQDGQEEVSDQQLSSKHQQQIAVHEKAISENNARLEAAQAEYDKLPKWRKALELTSLDTEIEALKSNNKWQQGEIEKIKSQPEQETKEDVIKPVDGANGKKSVPLKEQLVKAGKLVLDKQGKVEDVKQNSGASSQLFKDLTEIVGDKEQAADIYLSVKEDDGAFKKNFADWENKIMRDYGRAGFEYSTDPEAVGEGENAEKFAWYDDSKGKPTIHFNQKRLSRDVPFKEQKEGFIRDVIDPEMEEYKQAGNKEALAKMEEYKKLFIENINSNRDIKMHLIHDMMYGVMNEGKEITPEDIEKNQIRSVKEMARLNTVELAKDYFGEPMLYMHAGGEGIKKFRKPGEEGHEAADPLTGEEGIYFTRDLAELPKRKGFDKEGNPREGKDIYYTFLKYKKPYYLEDKQAQAQYPLTKEKVKHLTTDTRKDLEKLGYDAIIMSPMSNPKQEIVVFRPDQVEIAGTYKTGWKGLPTKKETTADQTKETESKQEDQADKGEPKKTGVKHEETAKLREEFGVDEYEKQVKKQEQLEKEAAKELKAGYNIEKLLTKMEKGGLPTDVEQEIMKSYIAGMADKVAKDPSNENIAAARRAIEASDRIGGTEVARSLAARRGLKDRDETLLDYFMQEMDANENAPLTEEQKKRTEKEFEEINKVKDALEKKIAELEKENNRLLAEQQIKRSKSRSNVQKKNHDEYVEERKQISAHIKEKLAEFRKNNQANVTIIPFQNQIAELAIIVPDVAKMVKSYVEEGVSKLDDIVSNIHAELVTDIPELTEDDVLAIIAGKYNTPSKPRREINRELVELKQQAKIILKLQELQEKEPTAEQKKIQRNQDIESLKKELKEKDITKLDTYKKRVESDIKKLQEELKQPVIEEPAKKEPLKLDKEAIALKDKYIKLKQEREIRLIKQQYENRTRFEKAKDRFLEVINIPRTIMSSMDFSAPLRQAAVATVAHPGTAAKSFVEMFKQAVSQKRFDRWFNDIQEDPRYAISQEAGLYLADPINPVLSAKEEAFMNNLAEKIPIIGAAIKGSQRAYVSYLNKMRWDLFNNFTETLEEQGYTIHNNKKVYEGFADFVNNITGRGKLPTIGGADLEEGAALLNSVFFAPRLIASRLNTLNPLYYTKLPKPVRIQALKDMAKFIGVGSTVLVLAAASGADVELDPRSSDFGKIRSGNTRWDIWGGYTQYIRTLAQILSGQKKNPDTKEIKEIDGKGAFGESRGSVMFRFFRGKLAPIPGSGINLLMGRDLVGNESTVLSEAERNLLPLIYSDVKTAVEDSGYKSIFTVGIPSMFGVGVSTYLPRHDKYKK